MNTARLSQLETTGNSIMAAIREDCEHMDDETVMLLADTYMNHTELIERDPARVRKACELAGAFIYLEVLRRLEVKAMERV